MRFSEEQVREAISRAVEREEVNQRHITGEQLEELLVEVGVSPTVAREVVAEQEQTYVQGKALLQAPSWKRAGQVGVTTGMAAAALLVYGPEPIELSALPLMFAVGLMYAGRLSTRVANLKDRVAFHVANAALWAGVGIGHKVVDILTWLPTRVGHITVEYPVWALAVCWAFTSSAVILMTRADDRSLGNAKKQTIGARAKSAIVSKAIAWLESLKSRLRIATMPDWNAKVTNG